MSCKWDPNTPKKGPMGGMKKPEDKATAKSISDLVKETNHMLKGVKKEEEKYREIAFYAVMDTILRQKEATLSAPPRS